MTFNEWYQAWQRLLKIINQHHPDEFDLWRTHFTSIMLKETHTEDWPLWLAYNTEVRCRSIITALDPSQFQKRLFDDLFVRYSSTKILMQVQSTANPDSSTHSPSSSRHQPYQRAPDNGYTSRFRGDSFRSHSSSLKAASRRCFFCGGLSHNPKTCIAATLVNGKPLLLPKPALLQTSHAPIAMVANTALVGMEKMVTAPSTNAPESMPARSAAAKCTTLSPAPPYSDFLIIVTPFMQPYKLELYMKCS